MPLSAKVWEWVLLFINTNPAHFWSLSILWHSFPIWNNNRCWTNILWDFSIFAVLICLLSEVKTWSEEKNTYKLLYPLFFSLRQRGDLLRERWIWQTKSYSSEDGEKVRDTSDSRPASSHYYSLVEQTRSRHTGFSVING